MTPRDEWRLYMTRNSNARRDYDERTRCGDCGVQLKLDGNGPPRMWCAACGSKRRSGKAKA